MYKWVQILKASEGLIVQDATREMRLHYGQGKDVLAFQDRRRDDLTGVSLNKSKFLPVNCTAFFMPESTKCVDILLREAVFTDGTQWKK